ncbi:MAG: thioredoxin [Candidatus Omnitrophota bacterium]
MRSEEMVEVTQENFEKEVVHSDKPVLVDFWAPWCMPCKVIAPAIDKIAEEMKGEIRVMKANVDESPEIATELSILNIPTLILFRNGQELARITGVNSKEAIENKIKSLI